MGSHPGSRQMPQSSYLYLKNGRYFARVRVPQSLRPWLCQHEIRWSLDTAHLKTARQHLLIALALIYRLFEQVEMEIAHTPLSEREKILLKTRIEQIKLQMLTEFRAFLAGGAGGLRKAQAMLELEQPKIDAYQFALEADHFDSMDVKGPASHLIEVVERMGYDFSALNPNYNYLARQFCEGMVRQFEAKQALLSKALKEQTQQPEHSKPATRVIINNYHPSPSPAPSQPSASVPAPILAPDVPVVHISAMVSAYIEEQKAQGVQPKTVLEYAGVLGKFIDFTNDAPINTIKGTTIKAFREALKKYPTRTTPEQKKQGFAALTTSIHPDTLGISTINKHLTRLSQLYHWAAKNEYDVKADLAAGHLLKDKRRESDQRDRYEQEDLDRLFSTDDFQGTKTFAKAAYYWAPLISLHTGMRIEEICQLRAQDIRKAPETGTPYFDVNDDDNDRKLKPGQFTRRIIPMHPALIALGLLDYWELVRGRKHRMLFPTLTRHDMNGYSHAMTKWFSTHKTKLGFGDKQTFHSFRHTVADTLKQAGIEEAQINAIMGHTGSSMSIERYGKAYKPDVLLPAILKINFKLPAKPFKQCKLAPAEKQALRSPAFAEQLKNKRLADRQNQVSPTDEA